MRFVDFLILLLQTQAQTLQRLAAFLGEEELLQLLEDAGDRLVLEPVNFSPDPEWFEKMVSYSADVPPGYAELEGAVQDLKLPAFLEFHLWAYPYYRSLIEGPIHLKSKIRGNSHPAASLLAEGALTYAKTWVRHLAIPPEFFAQAERAALTPWVRFRSEFLKKAGKRPVASI